jgi:hypothetical protein
VTFYTYMQYRVKGRLGSSFGACSLLRSN